MARPYFKQVEYLESTGAQYIDTEVIYNTTDTFKIIQDIQGVSGDVQKGSGWGAGGGLVYQGTTPKWDTGNSQFQVNGFDFTTRITGTIEITGSSSSYSMTDGTNTYTATRNNSLTSYAKTTGYPLMQITGNNGVMNTGLSAKLYGSQISINNILQRDFIPVLDWSYVPCMYDKVSGQLFYNQGTGTFNYGAIVEPDASKKFLRKKLALMLATLKKKRPYYCEVEYLTSTGTQYINTGYTGGSNSRVIIYASSTNTSGNMPLFGARDTTGYYNSFSFWQNVGSNGMRFDYTDTTASTVASKTWDTTKINKIEKNGRYNYVNDVLVATNAEKSFNCNCPFYLMAINTGNIATLGFNGNTNKCEIYNSNGVLVRDFIPVLDWNYVPCFYDKVSGQLFYNQGTGTFTYGREIHYVDYLESTGTQYIDTGYTFNSNTDTIELGYQNTATAQHKWMFGSYETNANIGISSATITAPTFWYKGNVTSTESAQYNARHTLIYNSSGMSNDGTNLKAFTSYSGTWNLYLFALNNTGTSPNGYFGYGKVFNYKQTRNGSEIINLKSAIDENGVGFMFDKVTHSCFLNAGTGVFKYPAREAEYIEVTDLGTNNQNPCIDLGLKYKPSMSIESKYTRTAMGISGSVLPLSNSTTMPLIYMPALNAGAKTDRFVWRRPSLPEASYYYDFADYPMTVEFKVDAVNDALTVNDNVVKTGMIAAMNGYTSPYESDSNLYMLSINGTYGGMGKVYYLKLYDGTQIYRDLVPVWKDGVACMYDKQNNVYYSNTKTGTVIAGKIIESRWF